MKKSQYIFLWLLSFCLFFRVVSCEYVSFCCCCWLITAFFPLKNVLTLTFSVSKLQNFELILQVPKANLLTNYWSTSWCVCCCLSLVPEQHDDFPCAFKCTVRVKSIVSPPFVRSVFRSLFFHSRTANTKAAVTFSDVFADVSMKLTMWNSRHHVCTCSSVISRSFDGTSFYFVSKRRKSVITLGNHEFCLKLGNSN